MPTIAVVGEVGADAVLPFDGMIDAAGHLTVYPGDGPATTAVALSRLGTTIRFAGRLSGGAAEVDLSASERAITPATLAIGRLDPTGAATYEFHVNGTADCAWTDELLAPLIDGPFSAHSPPVAIHTGTLALAHQPAETAIKRLLDRARERMTVSLDPNLRDLPVPVDSYRLWIDRCARLADMVRLSQDDLDQLWPGSIPEQAATHLHRGGVPLVVVSLGSAGTFASLRGEHFWVPIDPNVLDTVGVDDCFHGGMLHSLAENGYLGGRLETLTADGLVQALGFASRVLALTCSRFGANLPWPSDLPGRPRSLHQTPT